VAFEAALDEDKIGQAGEINTGLEPGRCTMGRTAGPGKLTEKEARAARDGRKFLSKLDAGVCERLGGMMGKLVAQQFQQGPRCSAKEEWEVHYECMRRHVAARLRNLRLKELRTKISSSWVRCWSRQYSVPTVTHVRTTVSAIFTHDRSGWLHTGDTPATLVRLPESVGKHRMRSLRTGIRTLVTSK